MVKVATTIKRYLAVARKQVRTLWLSTNHKRLIAVTLGALIVVSGLVVLHPWGKEPINSNASPGAAVGNDPALGDEGLNIDDSQPQSGSTAPHKKPAGSRAPNRTTGKVDDQERRLSRIRQRVEQAVRARRITQEQGEKLVQKAQDLNGYRVSLQSKPEAVRSAALRNKRGELREWARQNQIPYQLVSGLV